jgi:hypothetical protein
MAAVDARNERNERNERKVRINRNSIMNEL